MGPQFVDISPEPLHLRKIQVWSTGKEMTKSHVRLGLSVKLIIRDLEYKAHF